MRCDAFGAVIAGPQVNGQGETVSVARRSLSHFAMGRLASALVGVLTLLLLVRAFSRNDYGVYIALLAALEILQVTASPGAYAVVFRYLPELRLRECGHELFGMVMKLMAYRVATLLVFAVAGWQASEWLAAIAGLPFAAAAVAVYVLVLLFEGTARFVDVMFESLLCQGQAQVSVLVRNGLKLLALVYLGRWGQREVPLVHWLYFEAATTALGAVVSCALLWRHVAAGAQQGRNLTRRVPLSRVIGFSVPTYLSQVAYFATSAEMVKLFVAKLVGVAATATFGFAAILASTIQRYLPSFLLVGWVRPLFIAARQQGRTHDDLGRLAGTVIKLNMLTLAPIAAMVLVAGVPLIALLSGGRLPDSLPYLHFFLLLLAVQSIRAAISLLGVTLEMGMRSLWATCFSVVGLAAGLAAYPLLGMWALCAGLLVSETIWALVMAVYLRREGLRFLLPWSSLAKIIAGVLVAWAVGEGVELVLHTDPEGSGLLLIGAGSALACLAFCAVLRPFDDAERQMINRLLPVKAFVW